MIKKYRSDPLRYYFLREIPSTADGDFSERRFKELYNADLANGLGNLIARVAKLAENNKVFLEDSSEPPHISYSSIRGGYENHLINYEFSLALEEVWRDIKTIDNQLEHDKPWSLSQDVVAPMIKGYVREIKNIAFELQPFLPDTAGKILKQFAGPTIKSGPSLFPRLT